MRSWVGSDHQSAQQTSLLTRLLLMLCSAVSRYSVLSSSEYHNMNCIQTCKTDCHEIRFVSFELWLSLRVPFNRFGSFELSDKLEPSVFSVSEY